MVSCLTLIEGSLKVSVRQLASLQSSTLSPISWQRTSTVVDLPHPEGPLSKSTGKAAPLGG